MGINSLMAFESFVGVLFGGVAAAVTIGKVSRIQSIAQVRFSHPICVRYGTGAMESCADEGDECENAGSLRLPCPILEFRIINELCGEKGGEIMNASVVVVASILLDDAESERNIASLREKTDTQKPNIVGQAAKKTTDAAKKVGAVGAKAVSVGTKAAMSKGTALFGAGKRATHATGSLIQKLNRQLMWTPKTLFPDETYEGIPYNEQELEKELTKVLEKRLVEKLEIARCQLAASPGAAVDEGNAELAPPRTYHKLEVSR